MSNVPVLEPPEMVSTLMSIQQHQQSLEEVLAFHLLLPQPVLILFADHSQLSHNKKALHILPNIQIFSHKIRQQHQLLHLHVLD